MSSALDRLRYHLVRRFGAYPNPTKEHLISQITTLGEERTVRRLLEGVLAEPRDLRRVARRSYIHPNGYDKIVLVSARSTQVPFELRLHIWWPAPDTEEPDIHNHDWDFASSVLCGELWCEEYEPGDDGEPLEQYVYLRSQKRAFEIRSTGTARLRVARRYALRAEDVYAMDRMILHRVRGRSDRATATVVLQGPTGHLASEVFRTAAGAKSRPGSSPILPMEPGILAARLERVLTLL